MFASEIVDPAEDRHVSIDFVFGGEIHEIVIFDVAIRARRNSTPAGIHCFTQVGNISAWHLSSTLRFDTRSA